MEPTTLETVRSLALRQISKLKELKDAEKTIKESMDNLMESNRSLANAIESAKEAVEAVKEAKIRVKKGAEYSQFESKQKDVVALIKDLQESLNVNLVNYSHLTGSQVITDDDGKDIRFSLNAGLKSGHTKLL